MTTTRWLGCLLISTVLACGGPAAVSSAPRPDAQDATPEQDAGAVAIAPAGAPVLAAGCNSVTLSVVPSPSAATHYRVERSIDGGYSWAAVMTVDAQASTGVVLADQPAQPLLFRVIALLGSAQSAPSAVAQVQPLTIPDAPTQVGALPGTERATVEWVPSANDHGSPSAQAILADLTGAGNRFQFDVSPAANRALAGDEAHPLLSDAAAGGGTWSFRVSATNQCGTAISAPSNVIATLPWNRTLALNGLSFGMGAAQIGDAAYLIGGFDRDFDAAGLTLRTRQDPQAPADGRLLPWIPSGNLTVPRAFAAVASATARDGTARLYAAGGLDRAFQLSAAVETGFVQPDGSVTWSAAPDLAGAPLPGPRAHASGFVHRGFFYLLGGFVPPNPDAGTELANDVLVTRINADGTLPQDTTCAEGVMPAWRVAGTTPPGVFSNARASAPVLVVNDQLFVFGGFGRGEAPPGTALGELSSVYRIRLREDGTLDCPADCNWVQMPDLADSSGAPFPSAGGSVVLEDGFVYFLGGISEVKSGVVLAARLQPDDHGEPSIGPWTELPTFSPAPLGVGGFDRNGAAAFGLGSFLYVAGGLRSDDQVGLVAREDTLFAHLSRSGAIGP